MDAVSRAAQPRSAWWRRWSLRDVLFVTLPPMALAIWLFGSAVADYHRARQFDDWWAAQTSVRKFGWNRIRTALNAVALTRAESRMSAEREDVPQLRLYVDRNEFDRIDADVGANWGEWVDVQIDDHGELLDAELRFRGDGSAHWTTEKKSFTLKTKRESLYKGFRSMAFSVKDVLPQYLAATLAQDFGLLAPEQQVVPVFLNDRFYGLHRFVEPIDESFLRRNLRMPGNVFRADTAERGDYFKDLPREVFKNPNIWDRVANNDRPGAFGTQLLRDFLADVNDPSPVARERLDGWLDEDELSRLLAYLLVVGDPYHMSGVHNQFWYEDPVSGTLHPIPWDVRLLDLEKPPRDSNINHFWRVALEDPRIWAGTMRVLAEKLKDDSLLQSAAARMALVQERYADAIEYDTLRSGIVPPIGDAQEALATLRKNIETLRSWRSDAKASVSATQMGGKGDWVIDVVVEGRAPCRLTHLWFELSESAQIFLNSPLRADTNLNGVLDAGDRANADFSDEGNYLVFKRPEVLLPGVGGMAADLAPAPVHYRFFYSDGVFNGSNNGVRVSLVNEVTGFAFSATPLASGETLPMATSQHPWRHHDPGATRRTLSGELHLTKDLLIDEFGTLTIAPGTTLKLDPDVSIECRGKLEALGTAENPITIERANPDLPWGVFALQGPGADGSRLEHVKFLGGGGGQVGRVEYKGSVCVHYAKGVVLDHCEFAHNQRCDDLINVVKGEASITNSHFHHANADSIDYDMSGGLVAFNRIEGSGNDGLDLMTCWPRVIGNRIVASGDKGLSVGEGSAPLIFATEIRDCVRGIEVKDRSEPFVLHTTIRGCERGVFANLKNWRYGAAGWPKLVRSRVLDNGSDYVAEDGARVTLADTLLGSTGVREPGDAQWALRLWGIATANATPGAHEGWTLTEPLAPRYEGRFTASFADTHASWTREGNVRRVCLRGQDLEVAFRTGLGRAVRDVAWDLSDAAQDHVLVLELGGEGLAEVEVLARSPAGDVRGALKLAADPRQYAFATLKLPAAKYTGLALAANPTRSGARLRLHSWRVLSWPSNAEVR